MSTPPTLTQAFNAHAEAYDRSVEPLLPLKLMLHTLIRCQFSGLPGRARLLLAGAGTGAEARFLAPLFPEWHFTLVDPAGSMLAVARRHAQAEGFADRCTFHEGLVSSLSAEPFHAATSVLVSHFLVSAEQRTAYFEAIAGRLVPGGHLFNADLCADRGAASFGEVMEVWLRLAGTPDERKDQFRSSFGRDFAVHGPAEVETMIAGAGF